MEILVKPEDQQDSSSISHKISTSTENLSNESQAFPPLNIPPDIFGKFEYLLKALFLPCACVKCSSWIDDLPVVLAEAF